MNDLKQQLPHWRQWAAAGIATGCLIWLPLYMQNGYIGLVGGKNRLLVVFSALAALLAAVLAISAPRKTARTLGLPTVWLAGLCAVYTAGMWMAADPATALLGTEGRYNGLLSLLCCAALYIAVRLGAGAGWRDTLENAALAAALAVTAVGWLNYWKVDPFAVYYSLRAQDAHMFLSTVGNINFFGSYLCLAVPLALWRTVQLPTRRRTVVAAFLASGLLIANSEAAWLGVGVCLLAMLCGRTVTARQAGVLCRVGVFTEGIWFVNALYSSRMEVLAPLRGVSAVMGRAWVCLAAGLALFVIGYLLRSSERRVRPAALALSGVLAAGAAAVLVACNGFGVSMGPLDSLLRFDQTWGSNRGYVWYVLGLVYGRLPLAQKLLGAGGDAVNALLNPHYTAYIQALNGSTFDSAHNEYLQHLICGGAAGLACWVGFLVCSIRRALCSAPELAAALLGYAVQAFFSISMPGVLPLVFVLAALAGPEQPQELPPQNQRQVAVRAGAALILPAILLIKLL